MIFPVAAKFDCPRLKRFVVDHIPWRRVQRIARLIDIMHNTSIEIIKAKRDALNSNDPAVVAEMMEKKDIITILSTYDYYSTHLRKLIWKSVKANLQAAEGEHLSDEEVFGQV